MNVVKQIGNQDAFPGTHIRITSEQIGTTEICRQQHKIPFHKYNMLKEHYLLFAVEGINDLRIGGENFSLQKGEMLLLKKATYVEITKRGDASNDFMYESVSFTLKKDILIDFIKLIELDNVSAQKAAEENVIIHPYGERLKSFLDSLKPYFDEDENIKTGLFKLKILELLYDLAEANPSFLNQLINIDRNQTKDILKTIEAHYLQPCSLKELAYISGRSLSSFRREFESLLNTTPAKWIQEKRLNKAKELFLTTNLTISNVCYEVGYENVSHFSRLFKSHFGYNPSETKKQ